MQKRLIKRKNGGINQVSSNNDSFLISYFTRRKSSKRMKILKSDVLTKQLSTNYAHEVMIKHNITHDKICKPASSITF